MTVSSSSAVVLLSGGQDSATCLSVAVQECDQVMAIAFDYQQRHNVELRQAERLAKIAGVDFQVVDLSFISALTQNALTRKSIPIVCQEDELPSTFVEGRNLFFLSAAAVIAKQKNSRKIYTGVCQTDFSGYPDCRDDFIRSLNTTVNLAMDYTFDIVTPLMFLTKAQTVLLMQRLGTLDWYKETHTCYEGARPACGVCPACQLRKAGFEEANIVDPLSYA